jgi:hypothetical protein
LIATASHQRGILDKNNERNVASGGKILKRAAVKNKLSKIDFPNAEVRRKT